MHLWLVRRWLPAVLLCAVAPRAAAQAPEPGPFTAVAHFDDAAFARDARPLLDRVWQLARQRLGAPRDEVPEMVVHAYVDRAEYERVGEELGTEPKVFPGFAHYATLAAHIHTGAARDGAGALSVWTQSSMVHEAMHLSVWAVRGASMAFHPKWFVEGIAMWAETELLGEASVPARDIYSAARARTLLTDGRVPPVARLLLGDSELSRIDQYPVHRVLFELLMRDHAAVMTRVLRAAIDLETSPAIPEQLRDLLQRELGGPAWSGLDEALRQDILARAAALPEVAFVPPADQHGTPRDPDFHPGSPIVAWAGTVQQDRLYLTAQVTVRAAGAGQTDFVFGQHGDHWLRVCLVAGADADGAGRVLVLARQQSGDAPGGWELLARSKAVPALRPGRAIALRIAALTGSVTVDVDGKRAVRVATGKRPFRGRWGMGGPDGCRATWRELRLQ